jgi:hypothetical protein
MVAVLQVPTAYGVLSKEVEWGDDLEFATD